MNTCLRDDPALTDRLGRSRSSGYSLRRYFVDEFHFRQVPELGTGGRVLDLGGNRISKRGAFDIERYNLRVVYANISSAKRPDVQADALCMPFQDASFDAVVCSELLEHVADPRAALREAYRVLRAGGTLLICVPFLYRIHGDPADFGRYTDHYWRLVLGELGFQRVEIERQGLLFSVLVDFCRQYLDEVGFRRPLGWAAKWLAGCVQRWALRYEQRPAVRGDAFVQSFTTGFGIVALKPLTASGRVEWDGHGIARTVAAQP